MLYKAWKSLRQLQFDEAASSLCAFLASTVAGASFIHEKDVQLSRCLSSSMAHHLLSLSNCFWSKASGPDLSGNPLHLRSIASLVPMRRPTHERLTAAWSKGLERLNSRSFKDISGCPDIVRVWVALLAPLSSEHHTRLLDVSAHRPLDIPPCTSFRRYR